jgi:hypothetical protein
MIFPSCKVVRRSRCSTEPELFFRGALAAYGW